LTNAAQLTELKINDCPLSKIDLSPLSSCTNLQRLELYGNETEEYDLTPLLHLKSLDALLVWNSYMQSPVLFADSGLKETVESPAVQRLDADDEIEWR
jgi:Leucine-rich repeat (LRR) protein